MLSAGDVAERLGVSGSYVYHRWRALGIPFRRLGARLIISEWAFLQWLDTLPAAQETRRAG